MGWPKEAGDPRSIPGQGTWDPLANVDFAVVYERSIRPGG
jgi:hypothetical protein